MEFIYPMFNARICEANWVSQNFYLELMFTKCLTDDEYCYINLHYTNLSYNLCVVKVIGISVQVHSRDQLMFFWLQTVMKCLLKRFTSAIIILLCIQIVKSNIWASRGWSCELDTKSLESCISFKGSRLLLLPSLILFSLLCWYSIEVCTSFLILVCYGV